MKSGFKVPEMFFASKLHFFFMKSFPPLNIVTIIGSVLFILYMLSMKICFQWI